MIPPGRSKSSNFNCFGVRKLSLRVNPPDRDSIGNSQHAFRTRPRKPPLKSAYRMGNCVLKTNCGKP